MCSRRKATQTLDDFFFSGEARGVQMRSAGRLPTLDPQFRTTVEPITGRSNLQLSRRAFSMKCQLRGSQQKLRCIAQSEGGKVKMARSR